MEWKKNRCFIFSIVVAVITLAIIISLLVIFLKSPSKYNLTVIHMNDLHARFDELSPGSATCKPGMTNCIGGFARIYSAIKNLIQTQENTILVNAGDNFQGTIWYKMYKWNVTQYFLNYLPTDAITIGNHEFDDGIPGLIPFLRALKAPFVLTNVNDTEESELQGLYKKSLTLIKNNKKIGILGILTTFTPNIAPSGNLTFTDEIEAVQQEAAHLKDEGCQIIIVLSHCGRDMDRLIAAKGGPHINVIIGSHSHTLYYHGDNVPGPDSVGADYPDIVTQESGHQVYIVQSSCNSKYIGHLTLTFDDKDEIVEWNGNSIYLGHDYPQDEEMIQLIQPWKNEIDKVSNKYIATTDTVLDSTNCSSSECNIGDALADAYITAWPSTSKDEWAYTPIALQNTGGIRSNLDLGTITYGDLVGVIPYESTLDAFELQGLYLLEALEYAAASSSSDSEYYSEFFFQVSGLQFTINITQPNGERVEDVFVRCGKCPKPQYDKLNLTQMYRIVASNYLADGGDGYSMIGDNMINRQTGPIDVEITAKYFSQHSPLNYQISNRITIVK